MSRGLGTRVLATVVFTDVVESTRIAEELGDRRWRELLRRHHAIVRKELKRFRGREIDTAGDGFFALFDSPAQAVRCAVAVSEAVRELGIEIRAGLHLGEVELTDGKAQGVGVHIGARILAFAKPGDVLVSSPLKTTVAGSDVEFEARGRRRLKGVEGTWQLYAVAGVDGTPRTTALEPEEAEHRRSAIVAVPIGRRPRAMALLLTLAIIAVAAGVLIARRNAPTPPTRSGGPPVRSVVLIDPETNRAAQIVPDAFDFSGVFPPHLAAGEGSVWVLALQNLSAVDPAGGDQWASMFIGTDVFQDQDVEVGYRLVWVSGDVLSRINPATGDSLAPILPPGGHSWGEMAIGMSAVWAAAPPRTVIRLDPQNGKVLEAIELPGEPDELSIGGGSVWAADKLTGTVFRVDPRRNRVGSSIDVSGRLDAMEAGEGALWVLDRVAGTVAPIRFDTEKLGDPIPIGTDPTAIAVGLGSVWVAGGDEGTVWRVNPLTKRGEEIPVGGPVSGIAVDGDEGVVWVTISSPHPTSF